MKSTASMSQKGKSHCGQHSAEEALLSRDSDISGTVSATTTTTTSTFKTDPTSTTTMLDVNVNAPTLPWQTPAHLADEVEDLEECSTLPYSTATWPYIPEVSSCMDLTAESNTPSLTLWAPMPNAGTAAPVRKAGQSQKQLREVEEQSQRASHADQGSVLRPTFTSPVKEADAAATTKAPFSAGGAHVRRLLRCLSSSPCFAANLPMCCGDSSMNGAAASLMATSTSHACGVTTTTALEDISSMPSQVGKLSSASGLLVLMRSVIGTEREEELALIPNTYLVEGIEGGTEQVPALPPLSTSSFSPSPLRAERPSGGQTTWVHTSAYMRFERAVQWSGSFGNAKGFGESDRDSAAAAAAAQQRREAAMLSAAQRMTMSSF